jgi:hypothetical protein
MTTAPWLEVEAAQHGRAQPVALADRVQPDHDAG